MIKLFSGKDKFESYSKAKIELAKLASQNSAQAKIINADEIINFEAFIQDLEGVDMFSEENVILLKRIFSNKKIENYFIENYNSLKNKDIILWDDSADGRNKLVQLIKKDGLYFNFEEVNERDIRTWLKQQLLKKDIKISTDNIEYIIQSIGSNKDILNFELKKIEMFTSINNLKILNKEQLDSILGFDIKGNIWTFLDNFGERNRKLCLLEFEKLTTFEDNTQYLIAMIERELSLLAQIKFVEKNNIDPRELKLHPFVLKKTQLKASRFSWSEIKLLLRKLFELDLAIKRGAIDEKLGLSLFLLSI